MNRRDALKSMMAAPIAAAAPPLEPKPFDIEAFFASPEWTAPVLLKGREPAADEEAIIVEYQKPDPQFGRLRTYHAPAGLRYGSTGIRMPVIDPKGGFGMNLLSYSGRRDGQGRRIFA